MLLLVELSADPADPRLQRGASFMLDAKEQTVSRWINGDTHGLSCFWGNLLRYAVHSGLQDDPRLEEVIVSLTREVQTGWCCRYNGETPCAWGAGRALWALCRFARGNENPRCAGCHPERLQSPIG